jgi:hypothetical protein
MIDLRQQQTESAMTCFLRLSTLETDSVPSFEQERTFELPDDEVGTKQEFNIAAGPLPERWEKNRTKKKQGLDR